MEFIGFVGLAALLLGLTWLLTGLLKDAERNPSDSSDVGVYW